MIQFGYRIFTEMDDPKTTHILYGLISKLARPGRTDGDFYEHDTSALQHVIDKYKTEASVDESVLQD